MDDDESIDSELVVVEDSPDRSTRSIHEGRRFGENNFLPTEYRGRDLGEQPRVWLEFRRSQLLLKRIEHEETEIVSGMEIFGSGITESNDECCHTDQ